MKRYALILCVMKKVSIMEAQHNLSKVLKSVEEGQSVYITRRKTVIAKIVSPLSETAIEYPDFEERAKNNWQESWQGSSTEALLDEARGNR
jgi:prevent-host-death family protein